MDNNSQLSMFSDPLRGNNDIEKDSKRNAVYLIALSNLDGVGFSTIKTLFDSYEGDFSNIWNNSKDEVYKYLQSSKIPNSFIVSNSIYSLSKEDLKVAENQYEILKYNRSINIVFKNSAEYPQSLYDLPHPPTWLFIQGDSRIVHDPAIIGVVGTRTPTPMGLDSAQRLSVDLARGGFYILSGLAEGIDAMGHQVAVDFDIPTIAVLGHGLDIIFPASTSILRQEIIERGGAVISEYLLKDTYARERFVQRNRIQVALSRAVAVIEGKQKSGTAHTVRFAKQVKRPLFGACIGDILQIPQHELLIDLIRQSYPVFDIGNQDNRNNLRTFLSNLVPKDQRKYSHGKPHLFKGLIKEVIRLSENYDANHNDFSWLIDQISNYRDGRSQ
ncbi:DNA-processing protein DprA [Herpetosiphon llansteffanensis]|uniref:DNA-processing protein DprA n=1 Tax=Herpetosiphon llansteffanensis TaxID=2094568 RepID=UPI000D7BB60D|nr:DNA-processing protein DprA [Herpetosiphon llansteffanensis]